MTETRTLPSGRVVVLNAFADPRRPWDLHQEGGMWTVVRPRRGDSTAYEVFKGGRTYGQVFDEADARALVGLLNARVGSK
jgi:hypothetical protein